MNQRKDTDGPCIPGEPGESRREYGHSSGDRNTRSKQDEWPELDGFVQRDATPGAPGERSHEEPRR